MSEQNNQAALETIADHYIKEQRRRRRWGIAFKIIYLVIFLFIVIALLPDHSSDAYKKTMDHVAVINVKGLIFASASASAKRINKALDDAYEDKKTIAVILNINSPGGSPVQANDIYNHIMYLRKKHPKMKIYAVCADACASGSYYIAAAANDIYANPSSLVGSIGVIMEGFGFVDTLQKLGVTRRVYTAGINKDFMDPFGPVKEKDVDHAKAMLAIVHQQFIDAVKKGRGKRLKLDTPGLFSGEFWTGQTAKSIGLVDGFGDVSTVARNIIKNDNIVDYTVKQGFFTTFATTIGKSTGAEIAKQFGVTTNHLTLR